MAHLLAYATQHMASQHLTVLAMQAGLGTDRGLALLGEATRAQARSERSWTAAVAAAGLLRGRDPDPGAELDVPWLIRDDDADGGSR